MAETNSTLFDPALYRPPPFHENPATLEEALVACFAAKRVSLQFMELAELLLLRNPAVKHLIGVRRVATDQITTSQLVLATLFMLDTDVQNGGLGQFFFNCPEWVSHAPDSLSAIGCDDLATALRNDIQRVIEMCGSVYAFASGGSIEALNARAEQIEFAEFESAYYAGDKRRYENAVLYVRNHLSGFVLQ